MTNLFGQQRSQSGPGGLSINTGSANSLFASGNSNSTTSQPQSGGLFASSKPSGLFGSAATTAASAGTLFGTSTVATTQSGGLFGNTAAAPASKAGTLFGGAASSQGTSLFGSQSTTGIQPQQQQSQPLQQNNMFGSSLLGNSASQTQQSSSLFGNTTSQPQQTSSLFGNNAAQPQRQSLFGSINQQPQQQQQQQQGGGLFGSLNQNQAQQPQQPAGGLFGAQKSTSSLFSQPTQNTQRNVFSSQPASTLYPAQQPQRSVFSASIGQYTAASQSVPGVRIDLSNLRPTTRFEDLHESLQKEIVALDSFILGQMAAADECASALPRVGGLAKTIPADVEYCERKLEAAQNSLQTDASAIDGAKSLVRADADDARRSFKAVHALRMPAQFHSGGLWNSSVSNSGPSPAGLNADLEQSDSDADSTDLVKYFAAQAREMDKRLEGLTRNLGEVETYLAGVEGQTVAHMQSVRMGRGLDGGARNKEDKVRELAGVLREFEGGIMAVAGNVGAAREATQELMLADGNGWPGRQR